MKKVFPLIAVVAFIVVSCNLPSINKGEIDFSLDEEIADKALNIAKETAPQLVTLPFSQFKGKNGGTFDKSAVQHFAIYCNAVGDAVSSTVYLDDIQAVK